MFLPEGAGHQQGWTQEHAQGPHLALRGGGMEAGKQVTCGIAPDPVGQVKLFHKIIYFKNNN